MKSAVIAIDPISHSGGNFNRFCSTVELMQSRGLYTKSSVVSLIHSSYFPWPVDWYSQQKSKLEVETAWSVEESCQGKFRHDFVKVLSVNSADSEDTVAEVERLAQNQGAETLIVAANNKKGLPQWVLGSFSETAVLTSTMPVLVIKSKLQRKDFSKECRMVVAIDAAVSGDFPRLKKIIKMAKESKARVHLVYIQPKSHFAFDKLYLRKTMQEAQSCLGSVKKKFKEQDIECSSHILGEDKTIAQTLAKFADKRKAWMIVTVRTERTKMRKIFLGSTARKILRCTQRPFLQI